MSFPSRVNFLSLAIILLLLVSSAPLLSTASDEGLLPTQARAGVRSASEDSWPMYKGDLMRTGYSPSPIPMRSGIKPLWSVTIPSLKQTNAPIVQDGIAYIGSGDGWMRGFDIDTGVQVWQVKPTNKHISTQAAIDSGSIYFGADDGHVYGYDIATKNKVFDVNVNTSAIFASVTIADGMLFIGTLGRNLQNARFYGIHMESQQISWSYNMGETLNIYGFSGSAAYDSGKVYIGDGRYNMFCFDADGFYDGNDGPYTSEENQTLGSADIIWMYNSTSSVLASPMLAEGRVYFGNDVGDLFALDSSDGSLVWKRRIGAGEPPSIQASASYLDGTLYVAAQRVWGPYNENKGSSIHALDPATGVQKWRFNTTGQMLKSSPVVLDGALVFAAGSGNTSVFCISTENENIADEDRVIWYYNTRAPIWSSSAVADGRVFLSRPDSQGGSGQLFAFGSPDPKVLNVDLSDQSPFVGELVMVEAVVENNATVDVRIDIQFKASSFDFQKQYLIGDLMDIPIDAFATRSISIEWTVDTGYDMIVAFIIATTPEDSDKSNNFGTVDLFYNQMLREGWLSSGGGPGKAANTGSRLDSNRTYWTTSLEGTWQGPPEDPWYEGLLGNGSVSAAGGNIYMTGPDGSMVCLSSTPAASGAPETLWTYRNSSVDLIGRPALLIDRAMSLGGSNKIFAMGDDGALWAFDWVGFLDGRNDGPYDMEMDTGSDAGDVIWRTVLPADPAQSIFISGGNVIVPLVDGTLAAFDDDSGELVWNEPIADPHGPYAADLQVIFTYKGSDLVTMDPHTGLIIDEYDHSSILMGNGPRSLAYWDGLLMVAFNDTVALFDAYPDDNDDGSVDAADEDLGVKDNATGYDLIWKTSLGSLILSPPTPSPDGGMAAVLTGGTMDLLLLGNGSRASSFALQEPAFGRVVSAGDSFYLTTAGSHWTISAFSPDEPESYALTWTHQLSSEPRGDPAIMGDNMFITTRDGVVKAIGADNNPPVAVITSPADGTLLFPEEKVTLDASSSYDPEQDPLSFAWYIEGVETPVYEGEDPVVEASLDGIGRAKLILRVFDDMKAVGEDSINITLLKRITYPDHKDFLNDIYVHMSFGISEPSGAYIINSSIPDDAPDVPGAVVVASIDFTPLPKFADYRFEWANVSLGYFGREFPISMHQERLRLYHFNVDLDRWVQAPRSGVDLVNSIVWGNFTDLPDGLYAIGILDNSVPEFRHIPELHVFRPDDASKYTFRVEYRDPDGDIPVTFKLVIDNQTERMLSVEGVLGSTTKFTYFRAEGITLMAGRHSYYFEVDDGYFIPRSRYFNIEIENNPPEPVITWLPGLKKVREKVQFSGEGTTDPDNDELTYEWDFDYDGVVFDRDRVGKIVSYEFYEAGVYNVTLKVTDGKAEVYQTVIVTVIEDDDDPPPAPWWLLALVAVMAILIIAVVAFLVLSKKGHEEQDEVRKLAEESWSCPECGRTISRTIEECPSCGYEYDPLDFDEEFEEM
ncbi:MAG: PQQ-binding-like beta-propeller repeat protein [Thermoplasmatota archaeon]